MSSQYKQSVRYGTEDAVIKTFTDLCKLIKMFVWSTGCVSHTEKDGGGGWVGESEKRNKYGVGGR